MLPIALFALAIAGAPLQSPPVTGDAPSGVERLSPSTPDALDAAAARVARLVKARELVRREVQDGPGGRRDEWFVQVRDGVPIVGATVWRRTVNGTVRAIQGVLYETPRIATAPKLSIEQAREAFAKLAAGGPGPSLPPELVILPLDGRYVLTWRARVFTASSLTLHYLDAQTGGSVHAELEPGPPAPEPAGAPRRPEG